MRIGIAGYMGAGKTTYAHNAFNSGDTLIIDADTEAKQLMARDCLLQRSLQDAFGEAVVGNGRIRTDILGSAAFKSVESLLTLNRIVHPPLINYLKGRLAECTLPVCILDAALIPLLKIESWFDKCIWIDTPFEIRLERLKAKRNDIDERELICRMRLQEEIMAVPDADADGWVIKSFFGDGGYPRNAPPKT